MIRMIMAAAVMACAPGAVAQAPGPSISKSQNALAGQWSGTGFQVGPGGYQGQWTIAIQLRGTETSRIAYPSLGCLAELKPVAVRAREAEYIETITQGDCITGGRVMVREAEGKLYWSWVDPGGAGADASAVLYPADLAA